MSEMVIASMVLLWLTVIATLVVVLALARQIGVLHERLAPAGALTPGNGPKVGEKVPALVGATLDGAPFHLGELGSKSLLVLFVSPTCPLCKSLVPVAKSLAGDERRRMRLAFASDGGDAERHRAYVQQMGIGAYPYIVSQELGMKFAVGKLPFALLIGPDGTLHGKGLVNSREHLESLVEAMDSGIASLQDYLDNQKRIGETLA